MASKFSRISEKDCRMVLCTDDGATKPVSNFIIDITCEVEAGTKSGFLCDVYYYNGDMLV